MIIKSRVKQDGVLYGYITDTYDFISKDNTYLYNPDNVIRLKDGTWKAKVGYNIETINKNRAQIIIQNRNTHIVGKPNLLYNYSEAKLSRTQRFLLDEFKSNRIIKINKKKANINVTMKDISALTAITGLEYGLFERNDIYIIVKGTYNSIYLNERESAKLINGKFKWIGHTHPGNSFNCLIPSDGDYNTLKMFKQKRSTIYNSVGDYYVFGEEDEDI